MNENVVKDSFIVKKPLFTNQDIFNKIFADSLAQFSRIVWSFPALDNVLQFLIKLNKILQNFTE
jgi:hypothetical protein